MAQVPQKSNEETKPDQDMLSRDEIKQKLNKFWNHTIYYVSEQQASSIDLKDLKNP